MDDKKVKRIEEYAKKMGHEIDYEETARMKAAIASTLSDTTITIRIPEELKNRLKEKAEKLNIPYQRYIKSVLIDSLD